VIGPSRGIELREGAGLEPLISDDQSVALPEEDLDAIAATVEEEKEVSGEGILAKKLAHHPKNS
jgi:hypothetical protein